ncbi:hypothetical protein [Nocardioides litoris]|uniref:hypothetical protein n=1 Tax=Nocardioides litoris TaxID=1926648 RepID=UPI00111F48E8|nr:hypothetical protein [Nocardioides litoris]
MTATSVPSPIQGAADPEEKPMYEMYPEWGPAKNRDDEGYDDARAGVQAAFEPYDRPDDN